MNLEGALRKPSSFWIIWQPESAIPPKATFSCLSAATEVAERMAVTHSKKFYVMKAECVSEIVAAPVKTTAFSP